MRTALYQAPAEGTQLSCLRIALDTECVSTAHVHVKTAGVALTVHLSIASMIVLAGEYAQMEHAPAISVGEVLIALLSVAPTTVLDMELAQATMLSQNACVMICGRVQIVLCHCAQLRRLCGILTFLAPGTVRARRMELVFATKISTATTVISLSIARVGEFASAGFAIVMRASREMIARWMFVETAESTTI